jgi:hypothetical protein
MSADIFEIINLSDIDAVLGINFSESFKSNQFYFILVWKVFIFVYTFLFFQWTTLIWKQWNYQKENVSKNHKHPKA